MKRRLIALLVLVALVSGCAAGRSFRKGREAARTGDWDTAVQHYTDALQASPGQRRIQDRARAGDAERRARSHHQARELEQNDQLDGALIEYKKAVEMDGSNRLAATRAAELERIIRDRIEKSRPRPAIERLRQQARTQGVPVLNPADRTPLKINFNNSSLRDILNFIGTTTGINIQFDAAYVDKAYTVNLDGIALEDALQQILSVNGFFYKVLNPTTIVIAQDNQAGHLKYDDLVMQVFYLSHADTQEVSQALNTMMRIQAQVAPAIYPNKTSNTIAVRATAPVVAVAERLIRALDKPRAEVVIEVQILEVNRNRAKQFGINLSDYALGLTFSPEAAPPNTSGTIPPTAPPPFNLNTISQGISTSDFYLTVPTAFLRFLETDSRTKQLAKPQLRGAEGQELTLNLGDQIPVVSTVFGAAAAGGFANIPQSSFTYRDVGVNITMTPRVTYEGEIILDLTVESSNLGPNISVAGQDVPSFGSRRVKTRLRLREGESNLLAGLLKDDQRKSHLGNGRTRPRARPPVALRIDQRRNQPDRHRHAPDAAHRADARADRRRPGADVYRHAAERRADRAAAADSTAGRRGTGRGAGARAADRDHDDDAAVPAAACGNTGAGDRRAPGVGERAAAGSDDATRGACGSAAGRRTSAAGRRRAPARSRRSRRLLRRRIPPVPSAQITVTAPQEFRTAGGPYTVPLAVANASRLSMITLTVTFNPPCCACATCRKGRSCVRAASRPTSRLVSTWRPGAWTSPSRGAAIRPVPQDRACSRRCSSTRSGPATR